MATNFESATKAPVRPVIRIGKRIISAPVPVRAVRMPKPVTKIEPETLAVITAERKDVPKAIWEIYEDTLHGEGDFFDTFDEQVEEKFRSKKIGKAKPKHNPTLQAREDVMALLRFMQAEKTTMTLEEAIKRLERKFRSGK